VLFAAGYLVYILIIPMASAYYKTAKRQFYVQKNFIESRDKKIKELLRLKENFEDIKKLMFKRREKFFTDEEAFDFLNKLNKLAVDTGNELEKIRPQEPEVIIGSKLEQDMYYKKNSVELILKGKYSGLLELFKRFYDYEKLMGIDSADLKNSRETPLGINAKVMLNIYILGKK